MGKLYFNRTTTAELTRKYRVSAAFSNAGVIACGGAANPVDLLPQTTTTAVEPLGITNDTATYSATPAAGATGLITVSYQPENEYAFRACGGATEGTALSLITETAGDVSTPDLVTGTLPTSNSMVGGTVWRYAGEGQEVHIRSTRYITTHTSTTSLAVTIDFERAINIGDRFLMVPWNQHPGDATDTTDGSNRVQFTTNLYEADATIASGTGATVAVTHLVLKGTNDSYVVFSLGAAHPYMAVAAASLL